MRGVLVAVSWALTSCGGLWPHAASAQDSAIRPVPVAFRRYHHTVWPLGDVAPAGSQALMLTSTDGYLWLGAPNGIVRFDGVRFSVLDGRHTPALQSVRRVYRNSFPRVLDRAGRMWIQRQDRAIVSYENGAFLLELPPPPAGVRYTGPHRDGAGRLWVVVDSAGDEWVGRLVGGRVLRGTWPTSAPDTGLHGIVPDTADGMWVGTNTQGVWHVTPRGSRQYRVPAALAGLPGNEDVRPCLQSRDGTLWAFGRQLLQMRRGVWTAVRLEDGRQPVFAPAVVQAPDGAVYVGSRGAGVLRWSEGRLERVLPRDGAGGRVVQDLRVDREGTLWASTDVGVERFRRTPFAAVTRADGSPPLVPYEIAADAVGDVWMSERVTQRVYRIDGAVGRRGGDASTMRGIPLPGDVTDGGFQILGESRTGVWIAPLSGGLLHVTRAGTSRLGVESGLPAARLMLGVEDAAGALWLNLFPAGLARLRRGGVRPVEVSTERAPLEGRFAAGDSGRFVVFADRRSPRAFVADSHAVLQRLDARVPLTHAMTSPYVEGRDTVWGILTDVPAFARITRGRAAAVPFARSFDALPGFNPQFVAARGWLWFGSGNGVGRFPLAALHRAADGGGPIPEPQLFGPLDGLPVPRLADYGLRRMLLAGDGRIWLSTSAGLAVVDPEDVPVNRVPPPVHVEEVVADGRLLSAHDLTRIAPNPRRVDVHFTAASLRMPERVRIQYRLDGVEREWQTAGGPRVASYTQLRPGRYRFRVRAWNEDGVPSAGEATLALRVLPAWYQTGWAAALGVAGVAAAGAAGAGAAGRARRRRTEASLRATLAERARVARELHDTLLSEMTGVAMRLDAAASAPPVPAGADLAVVADVRDQARRAIAEARRAVLALRASDDDAPVPARIERAAHQLFAGADVRVEVSTTGAVRRYAPGAEAQVVRVVSEALANARKHADCRTVTVRCEFGRRALAVRVRDDGRGFDPTRAAPHGHVGLAGMRERAAAVGARLTIDSAPGRGTTVRIVLPARPRTRP
jgi:signal transduction histidine kinase